MLSIIEERAPLIQRSANVEIDSRGCEILKSIGAAIIPSLTMGLLTGGFFGVRGINQFNNAYLAEGTRAASDFANNCSYDPSMQSDPIETHAASNLNLAVSTSCAAGGAFVPLALAYYFILVFAKTKQIRYSVYSIILLTLNMGVTFIADIVNQDLMNSRGQVTGYNAFYTALCQEISNNSCVQLTPDACQLGLSDQDINSFTNTTNLMTPSAANSSFFINDVVMLLVLLNALFYTLNFFLGRLSSEENTDQSIQDNQAMQAAEPIPSPINDEHGQELSQSERGYGSCSQAR
jgi:hypothetical protein